MPNEGINTGAPAESPALRSCSRCRRAKPLTAFYRNPASICADCHNRASRVSHNCRRAALAELVARHPAEYRELLLAERAKCAPEVAGGGSDAA
jgi:hypothetical protein